MMYWTKTLSRGLPACVLSAAVAASMLLASQLQSAEALAGKQTPQQFDYVHSSKERLDYLLYLPAGYKSGSPTRWPLILFLHGAGERGSDISLVAKHGPPKVAPPDPDFGFVVVSPQCPDGQIWSKAILLGLLDEVLARHAIDNSRVYLTGLSMGGYGTWDFGLSYPERFAAIVPICGGGETISILLSSKPEALRSLPVWAFHGAKDQVVPVDESERMIGALKRFGAKDIKLTIYPEANHDSWTETYKNPELYRWLLSHQRTSR